MNYKIGLYIGHSYIGWATLELDSKNEPFKIIDVGSRVFDNTNINKNIFHPDLIHINCKDEKPALLPTNAPELEIIYDPAVRQSIFQLIKIINSIIKRYNKSPTFISLKFDDKLLNLDKNINARDKYIENAEKNILIKKIYNNFKKLDVTDVDLVKLKLWEEQDGVCPYSLKKICIERLFDVGYVDIDHIIAYSKCFDDSYNNKVLVFSGENHKKGDLLPLQYVKNKNDFIVWVSSTFRNQNKDKKDRLLMDCLSIEEEKSLKLQNINDTTYISNFIINYITKYLKISSNNANESNLVVSYSKGLFSYLMIKWAISKIKEYGDINNAINAIVVAHMTDNIIEKIEKYSKAYELRYLSTRKEEDKHIDNFPIPYHNFKTEIKSYIQKNPIQILDTFNNFNLADDIIESYRPIIDLYVISSVSEETTEFSSIDRANLVNILNYNIKVDNQNFSVAYAIEKIVKSLSSIINGKDDKLMLPEIVPLRLHSYE